MQSKAMFIGLLGFILLAANISYADALETEELIRQLQSRIEALEKKVSEQERYIADQRAAVRTQQQEIKDSPTPAIEGLEIGAAATLIVQGTSNTNNASSEITKKQARTDASYSADVTIGKEFKELGGKAFLHLEVGQGAGLEDNLTLFSNVNRDADDENQVHLTEVWYEQGFLEDKVALTLGKLDPTAYFDNNEVANDETTQFLGRIFRNSPVIEFPDNSPGLRLAYMPAPWLELGYGIFDADSDWEKINDNLFNIGQVTFKTNFSDLAGNYRFLLWHNNAYHTKWLATEREKQGTFGFGFTFDQELSDTITAFCRYGWQNPKVYNPDLTATGDESDPKYYSLRHSWSTGLQVAGKSWGREKDVFAFAVGQIFPSDDYKKAGAELSPARRGKAEGHLEAYYRIQLNEHLSLSPDFQYIWNPFGKDIADDTSGVFVGGMRAQVDF